MRISSKWRHLPREVRPCVIGRAERRTEVAERLAVDERLLVVVATELRQKRCVGQAQIERARAGVHLLLSLVYLPAERPEGLGLTANCPEICAHVAPFVVAS